jgi:hypothetical protein
MIHKDASHCSDYLFKALYPRLQVLYLLALLYLNGKRRLGMTRWGSKELTRVLCSSSRATALNFCQLPTKKTINRVEPPSWWSGATLLLTRYDERIFVLPRGICHQSRECQS